MNRTAGITSVLALTLAVLSGCSSQPSGEAKKSKIVLDKIQGKVQLLPKGMAGADAALSAGDSCVYLWQGTRRNRLFLRTAPDLSQGGEYVAEGINAQKIIDEMGDPDQGRNGYPLPASCAHVVTMAWINLAFDAVDAQAEILRAAVKRYPARPVFLVTSIRPATAEEKSAAAADRKKQGSAEDEDLPEVTVDAAKQSAALIQAPPPATAPLWDPKGGTVRCKVIINPDGKIGELESGTQLCESVDWSQYSYKPTLKNKVKTEVEVHFEPRK